MNGVRAEFFPTEPPTSTCFKTDLIRDGVLIEAEAVAALRR